MTEILNFLNEYAQLINFVLFATIIGWLLKISQLSRTTIEDRYKALLTARDTEILGLREQLKVKDEYHKNETALLQHNLAFYQHLASLPEDQRVEAIRHEYEVKLQELEERAKLAKPEVKHEIQKEKSELTEIAKRVLEDIDPATIAKVLELAVRLAGFPSF